MHCRLSLLAALGLATAAFAFPVLRPETRAAAAIRRAAAINFGSCSDPAVTVVNGLFTAANTKDFGSVQASKNLDDVVLGICNVLATNCGVDGITNGDCSTAASDAIGVGNTDSAADQFNSVLGISSDLASTAAAQGGGQAAATAAATTTKAGKGAEKTHVAAASTGKNGKGASGSSSSSGGKTECARSPASAGEASA